MRRELALRVGATLATVAALFGATGYVAAHPKDATAPLQPPLADRTASPAPSPSPTGRLRLAPGVRATELPAITITHVS